VYSDLSMTRRHGRSAHACFNDSTGEGSTELLTLWRRQPPSRYDPHRIEEVLGALRANRDLIDHIRKNGLQRQ
jgi:hypothetical protein